MGSWGGFPTIDPQRCVLGLPLAVECRHCVDACPQSAITQDEEYLAIDLEACSSCGLCQPACPQAAISVFESLPKRDDTALAACRVNNAGVLPTLGCVHGVDLAILAQMHEQGVRRIVGLLGACSACADCQGPRIEETLAAFNHLAESRGLAPIVYTVETDINARKAARFQREETPDPTRRGFLFQCSGHANENARAQHDRRAPLKRLLARRSYAGRQDTIFPFVPAIEASTCTGCDLCLRMCPEQALSISRDDGGDVCYCADAAACTGCGVCTQLCESGAISLLAMVSQVEN
ncbi:MAG TPA: 4Fe-4S binding protein, partial [Rhizobiaceae bacterium]|nr:4Fe-4S binding protein [Rhizobiaceae bacterium]